MMYWSLIINCKSLKLSVSSVVTLWFLVLWFYSIIIQCLKCCAERSFVCVSVFFILFSVFVSFLEKLSGYRYETMSICNPNFLKPGVCTWLHFGWDLQHMQVTYCTPWTQNKGKHLLVHNFLDLIHGCSCNVWWCFPPNCKVLWLSKICQAWQFFVLHEDIFACQLQ